MKSRSENQRDSVREFRSLALRTAAEILRAEAEKDTSRSKNDQAELRIAAAVCEGVAARG